MALVGAIPPPPGRTPNLLKPEFGGNHVFILAFVGFPVSTLFWIMRIYTKARINRSFGAEDVCISLAWFFCTLTVCLIVHSFFNAGQGLHLWEITMDEYAYYQKMVLVTSVFYVPALGFAKISLLLIFRRISPDRKQRLAIHVVMGIVVGYSIALIGTLIFACRPLAKGWDVSITDGHCINRPALYVGTASLNIATDIMILLIPIPMVIRLKLPLQQKIGLAGMFGVGSLTCITSVIRLITLQPMFTEADQTWVITTPSMWVVIEANLVIVCCCCVSLKSLLRHHAPGVIGEKRMGYQTNSYYERPRSKGLVITKDVSFNLTWQNDGTDPDRDYPDNAPYVEMDGPRKGHAKPTADPRLWSESQEGIIAPVSDPSTTV